MIDTDLMFRRTMGQRVAETVAAHPGLQDNIRTLAEGYHNISERAHQQGLRPSFVAASVMAYATGLALNLGIDPWVLFFAGMGDHADLRPASAQLSTETGNA